MDRFLTVRHLVTSAEEKSVLSGEADAVEMESFVILAEAARRGVRAVSVRAVSDTASTSLPYDFDRHARWRGRNSHGSVLLAKCCGSRSNSALCCAWRAIAASAASGWRISSTGTCRLWVLGLKGSESEMVAAV